MWNHAHEPKLASRAAPHNLDKIVRKPHFEISFVLTRLASVSGGNSPFAKNRTYVGKKNAPDRCKTPQLDRPTPFVNMKHSSAKYGQGAARCRRRNKTTALFEHERQGTQDRLCSCCETGMCVDSPSACTRQLPRLKTHATSGEISIEKGKQDRLQQYPTTSEARSRGADLLCVL